MRLDRRRNGMSAVRSHRKSSRLSDSLTWQRTHLHHPVRLSVATSRIGPHRILHPGCTDDKTCRVSHPFARCINFEFYAKVLTESIFHPSAVSSPRQSSLLPHRGKVTHSSGTVNAPPVGNLVSTHPLPAIQECVGDFQFDFR